MKAKQTGFSLIYDDVSEYGWIWFLVSLLLMIRLVLLGPPPDAPQLYHDLHHKDFDGNYGLYFTWWDRLCGTEHKRYRETFEEVTPRFLLIFN